MKLWDKGIITNKFIEQFTIGQDDNLDIKLAPYDVLGSLAHIKMLESINLLEKDELKILEKELSKIYTEIKAGNFTISPGIEDVHSQIEFILTERLGEVGKKIHSGRSRNDQVLVDLKLYIRDEIEEIVVLTKSFFDLLIGLSNQYKSVIIPGYTHLQVAMPSSFGLWFGAYAESLTDDLILLNSAYKIVNQNPLGSGAGYGSSFPLDRQMTTDLLGFDNLNYNSVYAQMTRGKTERAVSFALSSIAGTLSKMANDSCLYMNPNFAFFSFPDELTTGSSIMPHKKNPDVFELIRAKCNKIQNLSGQITNIISNLTSGYFRDLQIIKESFFESITLLKDCIKAAGLMYSNVIINTKAADKAIYDYMYTVENLNKEVLSGMPFRDAYKKIAQSVEDKSFIPEKELNHTHIGSIGMLGNDEISRKMDSIIESFNFEKTQKAYSELLKKG